MSIKKFTPGPWAIVTADENPENYVAISGPEHSHFADVVWKLDGDERSPACEANVYLIAAAPDMYEELECARDVFRFYQSHHEFKGGTEKAIRNKEIADRIDRLLAKARGGV